LWTFPFSFFWDNVQGRKSVVGVTTRLRGGHPRNLSSIPGGGKTASMPALGPTPSLSGNKAAGAWNSTHRVPRITPAETRVPLPPYMPYGMHGPSINVPCALSPSRVLHSLLIATYIDLITASVFVESVQITGLHFVHLPL